MAPPLAPTMLVIMSTGFGIRQPCTRMRRLDGITDSTNMNLGKTPGDGEGQGGPMCCRPWGHKESDMT